MDDTGKSEEDIFCEEAMRLLHETAEKLRALSRLAEEARSAEALPLQRNSWYRLSLVCKGLADHQARNESLFQKKPEVLSLPRRNIPLLLDMVK